MKDIQETAGILESHANAGKIRCNQQASVPESGVVWFGHDAIANIFGFADLVKTHHITHNLDIENAFWYTWEIKQLSLRLILKDYTS